MGSWVIFAVQITLSSVILVVTVFAAAWVRSAPQNEEVVRKAIEELGREVAALRQEDEEEPVSVQAAVPSPSLEASLDASREAESDEEPAPISGEVGLVEAALRGVPEEVVARVDALAEALGVSREEVVLRVAWFGMDELERRGLERLRHGQPLHLRPADEDDSEEEDDQEEGDEEATRVINRPELFAAAKRERAEQSGAAGASGEEEATPMPVTVRVRPPRSEGPITPTRVSWAPPSPRKK